MTTIRNPKCLATPATVDLTGSCTVANLAEREGWSPGQYAYVLSENIRDSQVGLDAHRERLAALAQMGSGLNGDHASAEELSRHFTILEALFHRFARQAHEALKDDRPRASEIADRFLTAALKAQKAAMATLSALKVLRDEHRAPTTSVESEVEPEAAALTMTITTTPAFSDVDMEAHLAPSDTVTVTPALDESSEEYSLIACMEPPSGTLSPMLSGVTVPEADEGRSITVPLSGS